MFGLNLFIISSGFFISDASNNPMILSASLIEDISAFVTTMALSAPAIAFFESLLYSCWAVYYDIVKFFF